MCLSDHAQTQDAVQIAGSLQGQAENVIRKRQNPKTRKAIQQAKLQSQNPRPGRDHKTKKSKAEQNIQKVKEQVTEASPQVGKPGIGKPER